MDHGPVTRGGRWPVRSGHDDGAARLVDAPVPDRSGPHGQARRTFKTAEVHRETWRVVAKQSPEAVAFVGRLYAVNLNTHRLQVQDDGGNQIALPKVLNDTDVGRLLGSYVAVTGAPEHDSRGRLTQIHDATINAAPDPLRGATVNDAVSLDEILQSAPGPHPNGGIDLTDDEFASFLEAARG